MVSHDRAFLNNLVTSTIALDGAGGAKEYVGGYDDWLRQSQDEPSGTLGLKTRKAPLPAPAEPLPAEAGLRRLTYKEQRTLEAQQQELAGLPARIEAFEAEQHRLSAAMAEPIFYQRDSAEIARSVNRLKELEVDLAKAYERWEELENLVGGN